MDGNPAGCQLLITPPPTALLQDEKFISCILQFGLKFSRSQYRLPFLILGMTQHQVAPLASYSALPLLVHHFGYKSKTSCTSILWSFLFLGEGGAALSPVMPTLVNRIHPQNAPSSLFPSSPWETHGHWLGLQQEVGFLKLNC